MSLFSGLCLTLCMPCPSGVCLSDSLFLACCVFAGLGVRENKGVLERREGEEEEDKETDEWPL